jgi:hypothetical protein
MKDFLRNYKIYYVLLILSVLSCNIKERDNPLSNKITIKPIGSIFGGHELVVIPLDPKYKPDTSEINKSLEFLKIEFPKNEINSEVFDSITCIDNGQNFETVKCNFCKKELSQEFWTQQMDLSYNNSHFENLNFTTNCCAKKTNLNNLIYEGDFGFASYSIAINNAEPNEEKELMVKEALQKILKTKVKVFWRNI